MESYSNKRAKSEVEPHTFRQGLEAYQYQAPSQSGTPSQGTGELSSMVHNVPTIPLHADSMAQVPFPSVSAPTPQRSAAAPSDSILQIKATRLARLFSSYTVEQCADVLRLSLIHI